MNNASIHIGSYSEDVGKLLIEGERNFVDSFFDSYDLVVHPALAILFLLFTAIALTLIFSVQAMTLYFRSFPAVKASSYLLGQLSFVGCYILIVCYLCFTVQKAAPTTSISKASLCAAEAWCLPLGLTLILGTVTAKTWRLYRIFVQLKKPGKLLKDNMLIMGVLSLAADVTLCSVWTGMSKFSTLKQERNTQDNTIEVRVECYSENYSAWFGALTLYQVFIMVSALVLALLTKNIHSEIFKTKSVIFLVYFLTITLCIGFPSYITLNKTQISINAEYFILSLTYLVVIILFLIFMFIPPIISPLQTKFFQKFPGLKKYSENVSSKLHRPSSFMLQGRVL